MDKITDSSILDSFLLNDKVVELEVVDDLWYLIVGSGGAVIVGSGKG